MAKLTILDIDTSTLFLQVRFKTHHFSPIQNDEFWPYPLFFKKKTPIPKQRSIGIEPTGATT